MDAEGGPEPEPGDEDSAAKDGNADADDDGNDDDDESVKPNWALKLTDWDLVLELTIAIHFT